MTDLTLFALDSSTFLAAVTGHTGTHTAVADVAHGRLRRDEEMRAV